MYLPKSKYTGGLYSNGEYTIVGSQTPYIGYYFKTTDGNFYTGKYPTDGPNNELSPLSIVSTLTSSPPLGEVGYYDSIDFRFNVSNSPYSKLKNITPSTLQPQTPTQSYPKPLEQDYQVGEFIRYFSKKINEDLYYETSGLFENDLYISIQVPWLLTGDKDKVYETNMNMVLLREQQLQISGLGAYLNFNYLKFYK